MTTGSLAEALASVPPRQPTGPPCSVRVLLEGLAAADPAGHDALVRYLDDPSVPVAALTAILISEGHALSSFTVGRHRRRGGPTGCRCPR